MRDMYFFAKRPASPMRLNCVPVVAFGQLTTRKYEQSAADGDARQFSRRGGAFRAGKHCPRCEYLGTLADRRRSHLSRHFRRNQKRTWQMEPADCASINT